MGTIYKNSIPYGGGGSSLPDGGTTGQALVKKSDTDQDVEWKSVGVLVAVYEQTSYADVKAAIDAHNAIVLDMPANNNQFCITFATYTSGGNALMYAIYKTNDKATLMTVTLTPQNQWTISHTDLQDKLVSGTNIKTVNNESLLGSGNVEIANTLDEVLTEGNTSDKTIELTDSNNNIGTMSADTIGVGNDDGQGNSSFAQLTQDMLIASESNDAGEGGASVYASKHLNMSYYDGTNTRSFIVDLTGPDVSMDDETKAKWQEALLTDYWTAVSGKSNSLTALTVAEVNHILNT